MTVLKAMLFAVVIAAGYPILFAAAANQGTPKEQAACRPDVRRYCHMVKPASNSDAVLACLEANRAKLSKACLAVLVSHGQ